MPANTGQPGILPNDSTRTGILCPLYHHFRLGANQNNLAEKAIRFVVLDRRVTQGARSERGRGVCANRDCDRQLYPATAARLRIPVSERQQQLRRKAHTLAYPLRTLNGYQKPGSAEIAVAPLCVG